MRKKKILKAIGIGVALVAILLVLFVVAFIFNPFEGSLPDMRELVPRDVDFFARKPDLADDFAEFPEPLFWSDLAASQSWRTIRRSPAYLDFARDARVDEAIDQIRAGARQLSEGSGGFASLLDDVLGEEVIVAGRFVPPRLERLAVIAYLRVSWKVRFFWGLLQWASVRSQLAAQGVRLEPRADGALVLDQGGGQSLYIARYLDCVLISNDDSLLRDSIALTSIHGAESFGGSADYVDGVVGRIRQWEAVADADANALELYLRPDQLFPLVSWDDDWPDPRSDDINERVLASFLNLKGWRFLTASLIFEADPSLTVLGRIDLNRNMHTGFQAEFFKSEPQDRSRWLDPFLSMVPEGAAAAAALRMPAREFLHEMYRAVDPELRPEIDRQIKRTGKFDGVGPMIDSLEDALLRRIGFVFYRARDLGEEITTFEPSKAPHVAWVFWIRPEFRHRLRDLYDFLTDNASTLGFDKTYDYPVTGLKGGDAAREFANANIPGTGEVVVLLYGNFFILSNSAVLVRHMVLARHEGHSILGNKDYEVFEQELPKTLNAFVFLQGKRIEEIVLDNIGFLEESTKTPDEGWMADNHARIERQVLRAQYPGARSVAEVPASQRDAFDAAVDLAKDREWLTARTQFIARDRSRLEQVLALSRMFSAAYLQATLDPQSLQTTSRILIDYR